MTEDTYNCLIMWTDENGASRKSLYKLRLDDVETMDQFRKMLRDEKLFNPHFLNILEYTKIFYRDPEDVVTLGNALEEFEEFKKCASNQRAKNKNVEMHFNFNAASNIQWPVECRNNDSAFNEHKPAGHVASENGRNTIVYEEYRTPLDPTTIPSCFDLRKSMGVETQVETFEYHRNRIQNGEWEVGVTRVPECSDVRKTREDDEERFKLVPGSRKRGCGSARQNIPRFSAGVAGGCEGSSSGVSGVGRESANGANANLSAYGETWIEGPSILPDALFRNAKKFKKNREEWEQRTNDVIATCGGGCEGTKKMVATELALKRLLHTIYQIKEENYSFGQLKDVRAELQQIYNEMHKYPSESQDDKTNSVMPPCSIRKRDHPQPGLSAENVQSPGVVPLMPSVQGLKMQQVPLNPQDCMSMQPNHHGQPSVWQVSPIQIYQGPFIHPSPSTYPKGHPLRPGLSRETKTTLDLGMPEYFAQSPYLCNLFQLVERSPEKRSAFRVISQRDVKLMVEAGFDFADPLVPELMLALNLGDFPTFILYLMNNRYRFKEYLKAGFQN